MVHMRGSALDTHPHPAVFWPQAEVTIAFHLLTEQAVAASEVHSRFPSPVIGYRYSLRGWCSSDESTQSCQ